MSSTNRGSERVEADFYPTPLSAFEPLIPYLDKSRMHWECACGDGRLVKAMKAVGMNAVGSDINGVEYLAQDFLKVPKSNATEAYTIITNPPFSLAFEFCQHAVRLSNEVFMLLRLNFLGSQKRRQWFKSNEPAAIFVLSSRPAFVNGKTDSCDYGWFYWAKEPRHAGIIHL